jgi:hypothetical protein
VAYSYVRYSGNGSTTNYTFSFPTISTDHIKVRVNGTLVTNWSFLNSSTIQFAAAPASGAVIEIRRETPKDSTIVNFTDGSVLLERDLDLLATWQLYLGQETEDDIEDTIRVDSQSRFDAQNRRIINVADPINAQDAVTKVYADAVIGQATAAASAAAAVQVALAADEAVDSAASALAAASSATAAAGSATTATAQATNAAASAVNAANSAAAAATALDNFDDRYLGQKASDPATDNDGNALITGALYYNTTDGAMRVYTGTGWINASSAQIATLRTYVYVATAAQTLFSGSDINGNTLTYVAPYIIVSLNGLELRPTVDYTMSGGSSVTLTSAAALGEELQIQAFSSFNVANIDAQNVNFTQAGTGVVPRTVQDELRDHVSVKQFGAVGDGITDDTAAINSAIVAAYMLGIGDVHLVKNSTYLIDANANPIVDLRSGSRNGGVKLKSNVTLHLNGATLKAKTSTQLGYSVVNFSGTDNAALVGPGFIQGELLTHTASGGEWGYGIYAVNCTNFKIKDVDIRSCWGDGIYIGTSTPTAISTRAVGGDIYGVVSRRNRRQGCSISAAANINFTNCTFKETGVDGAVAPASGVDIESDIVEEYSENINFTNCTFSQNLGYGLILSGWVGSVKSVTVTSCQIIGNVQGGLGAVSALKAKFVATKIEGGVSGGLNCSLVSCDVENSTGYSYPQAISLFSNANFEMIGGSVKSDGAGYTLLYTNTNSSERTKNIFNGVKFILANGPSSTVCNVNGFNLFESCGFFTEGTTPSGNFGFDTAKFHSGGTQILNCWFDPTWHTGQSGGQFKGNITQKGIRGAYGVAPNYGTWGRGDIVFNPEPTELGPTSSKYVVTGWICTVSGSPGTWLPLRTLTGN